MNEKYINSKSILNRVREEELYFRYCNIDITKKIKTNPIRNEIPCNSFKIHKKNGRIKWSDFGSDDFRDNDIFDLIQIIKGWSFYETLLYINRDFNLGYKYSSKYNIDEVMEDVLIPDTGTIRNYNKDSSIIEVVLNKYNRQHIFTKDDLKYWNSGYINKNILQKEKVFSVNTVLINGNPIWYYHKKNPIYLYYEQTSTGKAKKLYRPLESDKDRKWLSDIKKPEDFLYGYAPELNTDYIIITKSKKDYMELRYILEFNSKYVQAETYIPIIQLRSELQKKYPKIYILYDNDKTGLERGNKVAQLINGIPIHYGINTGCKDTWDTVRKFGVEQSKEIINKLMI